MIKLCGIRRREDISYINEALPDYMGMILAEGFRRTVDIDAAAELVKSLDGRIKKVGVFVDTPAGKVRYAAEKIGLDVIQLHGNEDRAYISALNLDIPIWKAVRVKSPEDILSARKLGCSMLLLDSFVKGQAGGTGTAADWEIIKSTGIDTPFFLAGGINEMNIKSALKISSNIDLSGSVETDGAKDREKILNIMSVYKTAIKENTHE